MLLDEPSWWYAQPKHAAAGLLPRLLQPIAGIYGAVAGARISRPPAERAAIPVICVGNFTAGGTGKTPIALKLAQLLRDLGRAPVFLSRGYGGIRRGPHLVDLKIDHAGTVGDEPLLLAASEFTVVARDRAAGARHIVAGGLGDVIIMDDGLQNQSLAKNLTIAVIDSERGLGNARVIPAGPLRAPIEPQLALTDAIVISAHGSAGRSDGQGNAPALPASIRHFGGPCFTANIAPAEDIDWISQTPLLAYAGIANPDRFFRLLEALGGDVRQRCVFRDHHVFGPDELETLLATSAGSGLQLVTTEKDYVRLSAETDAAHRIKQQTKVLRIQPTLAPADQDHLNKMLSDLFV